MSICVLDLPGSWISPGLETVNLSRTMLFETMQPSYERFRSAISALSPMYVLYQHHLSTLFLDTWKRPPGTDAAAPSGPHSLTKTWPPQSPNPTTHVLRVWNTVRG